MTNLAAGPFFPLNPCNAVITITYVPVPGVSNAVETSIDLHQMSSSDRSVSVLFESATSSDFFLLLQEVITGMILLQRVDTINAVQVIQNSDACRYGHRHQANCPTVNRSNRCGYEQAYPGAP